MIVKKPECLLHIGAAKTGTTSLQFGLSDYDDGESIYARFPTYPDTPNHSEALTLVGLGSEGVDARLADYAAWRKDGTPMQWPNSIPLKIFLREGKAPDMAAARDAFDATISTVPHKRVIYSGEALFTLHGCGRGLIPILNDRFERISTICYLRSCIGGFVSRFQQRLAQTNQLMFFGQASSNDVNLMTFNDAEILEQWLDLVPEDTLTLAVYGKDRLKNGDVVDDFCDRSGLDAARAQKIRTNTSFSAEATAVLATLAKFGNVAHDNPHFAANKAFFNVLMYQFGREKLGVSDRFANRFLEQHGKALDWLDDKMGSAYARDYHAGSFAIDQHEDLFDICASVLPDLRKLLIANGGRAYKKMPLDTEGFATFISNMLAQPNPFPKRQLPASFDARQYLALNPDIARLGIDPKGHFLSHGCFEGRFF